MNEASTTQAQTWKWYGICGEVFRHPSAITFERILADPKASPKRAYGWAVIMFTLMGILGQVFNPSPKIVFGIFTVLLGTLSSLIGLVISAWLFHMLAKLYHGQGTYSRMVVVMGAIFISPYYVICVILQGVWSSQEWLPSLFTVGFNFFFLIFFLQVQAIKAAERLGTSHAFWTLFLPLLSLAVLAVVIIFSLTVIGPAIVKFGEQPLFYRNTLSIQLSGAILQCLSQG